jgi:beta-phosphoglucomutase-like phosphatase (HAD superfamily)
MARSQRTASDRLKVEMMLKPVGPIGVSEGRIFSGHGMPRSKPHPDVYLAAAAHLQIDPARCLVIEDTKEGITAGVAAGATVWAYAARPRCACAAGASWGRSRVHGDARVASGLMAWLGLRASDRETV